MIAQHRAIWVGALWVNKGDNCHQLLLLAQAELHFGLLLCIVLLLLSNYWVMLRCQY